jgi:hypothetical protein
MRKMRPQISHICVVMAIPFQCTKFHRLKPNTPPAFQRGGKSSFGQRDGNEAKETGHRHQKPDTFACTSGTPMRGHSVLGRGSDTRTEARTACRPHFEVGRHGNMATPRLQRVAPGRDLHMFNLVKSRSTFKRLGSDTCLYWRAVVTLPFLLGKANARSKNLQG